jgi:hypothetical protein
MQFYIRSAIFTTFRGGQMGGTLARDGMHILQKRYNAKKNSAIRASLEGVPPSGSNL